ncbi:MAG: class I SAM-dependent methyltransferase, partial [Ignavibacteriales bacterium]|nr:class I SAM-dependent methyltransferase [Ignavibacteriales bacterium]
MTTVWKTAQEEELHCWSINREKLRRSDYLEIKKLYWQRLLSKIGILHVLGTDARILEVGCGPAGVFLLLPRESRNDQYYVLDPLLARYKEMFPDYFGRCVEVDSALETWRFQPDLRFDLILAINCIDHSLDIEKFLAQVRTLLSESGRAIVAVNTHQRRWTARLWKRFQKVIEPHHPYHFT